MNQMSTKLSKKIIEMEESASSAKESGDVAKEILELVNNEVIAGLEITNVTLPYILIVLEGVCDMARKSLDGQNERLYGALKAMFRVESAMMKVPGDIIERLENETAE